MKRVAALFLSFSAVLAAGFGMPAEAQPAPSIAFFYGARPPVPELSSFDDVVVEPDSGFDPRQAQADAPHTRWFAYASVGEQSPARAYFRAIPPAWLLTRNAVWQSAVVDQAAPGWPAFYVDHVIAPLWDKGYRGFFLDTLDAYQLAAHDDAARERQRRGLIAVVRAIKARYPDAHLIFNRGFEILPEVHGLVDAVAFESLFRGWDQAHQRYTEVPQADRDWLLAQARTIAAQYRLPVVSIDYCAPADRACARDAAARIRAAGVVPYVADGALSTVGVGTVEVMPRRVLVVEDQPPRTDLNVADGPRYLATPLNYLGYRVEYVNVDTEPLPAGPLNDRYAGIVIWLNDAVAHPDAFRAWLERQIDGGMHVAVTTGFGLPVDGELARKLDLMPVDGQPENGRLQVDSFDASLIGFEAPPVPDPHDYVPVRAGPSGRPLLTLRSGAFRIDAAALMPWGGYVLRPFATMEMDSIDQARWIVQPLEFLRRALRLPSLPTADVTTENGRRLFMSHIDGDGFASKAEFDDGHHDVYSGEVLYRVLQRYGLPVTTSVIEAELSDEGPHRAEAAKLRQIARRIFALPNVEMASHTYTHPLQWMRVTGLGDPNTYRDVATEGGSQTSKNGLAFDIPGYQFNVDREIGGSVRWIDRELAPPGKSVQVLLWSGDCQVPAAAVKAAYDAGVMNLNGGDTTITRSDPSWTAIAPLGVTKGGYYQVYAPNQNEEIYTNLWDGPYYGFRRVLETFAMTDRPLRFKPIDVYYHFFTGTKQASLTALEAVYDAVLQQPLNPVFVSEYARKVLDFERLTLARTADGGWLVRDAGALRTVRLAPGEGPALDDAQGVAGFTPGPGGTYVSLTGSEARFRVVPLVDADRGAGAARLPYLADADGRLERFTRSARGLSFDLASHVAPAFTLANAASCRVRVDGRAAAGAAAGDRLTSYRLGRIGVPVARPVQSIHVDVDCAP